MENLYFFQNPKVIFDCFCCRLYRSQLFNKLFCFLDKKKKKKSKKEESDSSSSSSESSAADESGSEEEKQRKKKKKKMKKLALVKYPVCTYQFHLLHF